MPAPSLSATYADARSAFLNAAANAGASVTHHPHPLGGPDGGELAVDVASLGPADATDIVLVMSGTHGVEGYCGSAVQTHWLNHVAATRPEGKRVVMIHALNPFGFAWVRRVNEDNVDLNRNFLDWDQPVPHNDEYDDLADALVPDEWTEASRAASLTLLAGHLERLGPVEMQRAVSRGQYRHPDGLFYGGTGPTWSNRWLTDWLTSELGGCARLILIDVHTGLGPWGHGEYIIHHPAAHPAAVRANAMWPHVRSAADADSVSVLLSGDALDRVDALLPDVEITSTALEFGTVDQISVLESLRADAWLWSRGDPQGPDGDAVRAQVRTAFADEEPAWIATVWDQFDLAVASALAV